MKKTETESSASEEHSFAAAVERAITETPPSASLEPRKDAAAYATRARYEHG
jgi:hypothetical protein